MQRGILYSLLISISLVNRVAVTECSLPLLSINAVIMVLINSLVRSGWLCWRFCGCLGWRFCWCLCWFLCGCLCWGCGGFGGVAVATSLLTVCFHPHSQFCQLWINSMAVHFDLGVGADLGFCIITCRRSRRS